MPTEKVTAQYIIDIDEKGVLEGERVRERLQSPITTKFAMDLSALKEAKRIIDDEIKAKRIELKVATDPGKIALINSELQKLGASSIKTGKEIKQANKELDNFVNTGNIELSKLGYYFKSLGLDIEKGLGKSLLSVGEGLSGFLSGGLVAIAGGSIATGLYKMGSASLSLADKLEQNTIAFETMLGSGEKARILLNDLSQFASKTPFEIPEIRSNAKQLLAMGISADNLIPTMKALGDVSAGLSVPMDRLALAYGQVIAKGKLQGGELKQFTEAGVPLIETLSNRLGVSTQEFYKMVEAGNVSSQDVVQAFQDMTGEGGKFANLMAKQSGTLSGMWSNFKDQLTITGEKLGMVLLPYAKQVVQVIGQMTAKLIEFGTSDNMMTLYSTIGNVVSVMWQLLGIIYQISGTKFVFEGLYKVIQGIAPVVNDIVNSISVLFEAISLGITQLSQYWSDTFNELNGITGDSVNQQISYWDYLTTYISVVWANLIGFLTGTFDTLFQVFEGIMNFFTDKTNFTSEAMKGAFISVASAIANTVLGIVNTVVNLLLIPINTAINGLNQVISLANKAGAGLQSVGNIEANFSVGNGKGVFDITGERLLSGFETFATNVNNAVTAKTESMIQAQVKGLDKVPKNDFKIPPITPTGGAGASGGGSKGKSAKDIEKEKQKILEESAKSQEKYFKKMKDKREKEKKEIEDYVKKLQKAKDDIIKIDKEIQDALSGSDKQKSSAVASYMRGLLEEQKTLQAEAENALQNGEVLDPTFESRKQKLQSLIDEAKNSGLITQQDIVKEEQRVTLDSLGQNRFDLQDTLANIELEKEARVNELKQKQYDIETELGVKRDAIDKEIALQQLRARENELALREYSSAIRLLEGDITSVTESEVKKRMDMYNKEMAQLQKLIALRTSAGVSTGGQTTQTTTNVTNNNTPTVNVQANVSNNVDVNYLASQLAKRVSLSNKGIN